MIGDGMRGIGIAVAWWAAGAGAACAEPPDWLAGAWLTCSPDAEVSETWVGAAPGPLFGVGLTRGADGEVSFEFMRSAPNAAGVVTFYGSPEGAPPTAFAVVAQSESRIVFENLAHDFPQRIIYAREGDALSARIESADGASGSTWRYRRAALGERC